MRACVALLFTLVATALAWGGAANTGGACTVVYPSGGATNVSCTVTFTGGSAHDGFSRTSTSIRNVAGGHTLFSISGTFGSTCPQCSNSYCTPPPPIACYSVVYTTPNPDKRIISGCYNGGSPNPTNMQIMPDASLQTAQPWIGNFPANSDFSVIIEIVPGQPGGCQASWANMILSISQPAKRDISEGDYVPIEGYWN